MRKILSQSELISRSSVPILSQITPFLDKNFGFGRYAKTAHRLREKNQPCLNLSHIAIDGEQLIGVSQIWPLRVGTSARALLLGPFAVLDSYRGQNIGRDLISANIKTAIADNWPMIILIGDESYFGVSGFKPAPIGQFTLPGPVNPARLLVQELTPNALINLSGRLSAPI